MTSIQAYIGFSQHDTAPVEAGETAVPGYPDNRVMPLLSTIEDARENPAISLDEEGFTLARHQTAFADERDLEVLRRGYHDEMAAFLTDYLDATLVVPARAGILVREGRRLMGRAKFDGDPDVIDDRADLGSLTVPFRDFSIVLKCQCAEVGPTGFKEAILFDHLAVRRDYALRRLQERPSSGPRLVSLHVVLRVLCEQGYERPLLNQIGLVLAMEPRFAGVH